MRYRSCSALGIALLAATSITSARAADCVDTTRNNPAFASAYVEGVKPCPKPLAPLQKPAVPAHSDAVQAKKPGAQTAAVLPKVDHDHPAVTHTPNGTLITFGETTVCVRGSVTVDVSTGNGQRRPHGADGPEATCN